MKKKKKKEIKEGEWERKRPSRLGAGPGAARRPAGPCAAARRQAGSGSRGSGVGDLPWDTGSGTGWKESGEGAARAQCWVRVATEGEFLLGPLRPPVCRGCLPTVTHGGCLA